jgi:2-oxoglutarate/2-oxoacid ferredoxin oxidoreductase subunit beta
VGPGPPAQLRTTSSARSAGEGALSRLDSYDFTHTPIGVFRSVERGSYDDAMAAQIETAHSSGAGDLAKLLAGSDTWEVG